MLDQCCETVGVRVHLVAGPRLGGLAVTATVVRDRTESLRGEMQRGRFPRVGVEWPPVAEQEDGTVFRTPVLVEDLCTVLGGDLAHVEPHGFFGRQTELSWLRDLAARARDGVSAVAVMEGDAGIGQTCLPQSVIAGAECFDALSLTGVVAENDLPFAAVQRIVTARRAAVDELPATHRQALLVNPNDYRRRVRGDASSGIAKPISPSAANVSLELAAPSVDSRYQEPEPRAAEPY